MIPHPVGVASDVDEVTVVDQPVDERGGQDLVAENGAPPPTTDAKSVPSASSDRVSGQIAEGESDRGVRPNAVRCS